MGLMESGCTRQDFGRDVQPAIPNRTRCWAHVGSTFGAISDREAFLHSIFPILVGIGGEPVSSYRAIDGGLEENGWELRMKRVPATV